jgi:hypothetical protein
LGSCSICGTGCGTSQGYDRYVPRAADARAALDAALRAWKDGQAHGTVRQGTVAVEPIDPQWRDGKKLITYEIVQEERRENIPWFSVRLNVQGAAEPQTLRYVVMGIDPLWVYREDEFQRLSGK